MSRDIPISRMSLRDIANHVQAGTLSPAQCRALLRDPRAGARRMANRLRSRDAAEAAEAMRLQGMLEHETLLWNGGVRAVAGLDEVGVGPLAGPVVAAAVVLPPGTSLPGVDDSKRLTAAQRATLAVQIKTVAVAFGIGMSSVTEIDTINILRAALQAMTRAVAQLPVNPEHGLVDGRNLPCVPFPLTGIIGGDRRSQSIAAASIIAKVERDALMDALGQKYPGYGFESHRGYATAAHLEALSRFGPCPAHRRSFAPVSALGEGVLIQREVG